MNQWNYHHQAPYAGQQGYPPYQYPYPGMYYVPYYPPPAPYAQPHKQPTQTKIINKEPSQHSSSNGQSEEMSPVIKKDNKMDSPEEIRKWLESRKRNYPTRKRVQAKMVQDRDREENGELAQHELSLLEVKLRKQIKLSHFSPKNFDAKARNLDIIRNILTNPTRRTKNIKKGPERTVKPQRKQSSGSDGEPDQQPIKQSVSDAVYNKADQLIESLKHKREEDRRHAETMFDYRYNSHNYKYMKNTLTANMLLEDIFKENCYLLQAIRYIVKTNFLEDPDEILPVVDETKKQSEHECSQLQQGEIE